MMDRQHGKFLLECETCAATFDTETGDFDRAQEIRRSEGWKARPDKKGGWLHFCPGCSKS